MVIKGELLILSSYSLYCRIHPWIRQQEVFHGGLLAKNELFDGYNVYPNINFYWFFLHVNFTSIDAGMTMPTQRCCSHTYHPFSCIFKKTPEGRIVKIKKKNTGKKHTTETPHCEATHNLQQISTATCKSNTFKCYLLFSSFCSAPVINIASTDESSVTATSMNLIHIIDNILMHDLLHFKGHS